VPDVLVSTKTQDYTDILCSTLIERAGVFCVFGDFDAAQTDVTEALTLLDRWRQNKMATITAEGETVPKHRLPLSVLQSVEEEVQRWVGIHLRIRQQIAYLALWSEKLRDTGPNQSKLEEAFKEAMDAAADSSARQHASDSSARLYGLAAELALTLSRSVTIKQQRVTWLEKAEQALDLAWQHTTSHEEGRSADPRTLRKLYGIRAADIAHLQLLDHMLHGYKVMLTEVQEHIASALPSALAKIEAFGEQATEAGMAAIAASTSLVIGEIETFLHRHAAAQETYEHVATTLASEKQHEQFRLHKLEAERGRELARHNVQTEM